MVDSMSTAFDPKKMAVLPESLKKVCCGRLATGKEINVDVYHRVRDGLGHGTVPHKNFYAYVWYQGGIWFAEVWRKGFQVASYSSVYLTEILQQLTETYGSL